MNVCFVCFLILLPVICSRQLWACCDELSGSPKARGVGRAKKNEEQVLLLWRTGQNLEQNLENLGSI